MKKVHSVEYVLITLRDLLKPARIPVKPPLGNVVCPYGPFDRFFKSDVKRALLESGLVVQDMRQESALRTLLGSAESFGEWVGPDLHVPILRGRRDRLVHSAHARRFLV